MYIHFRGLKWFDLKTAIQFKSKPIKMNHNQKTYPELIEMLNHFVKA